MGRIDGASISAACGRRRLVWFPVALYLLVTGAVWQGLVLIAFGVLVVGLVDNLLRPILVGTDIRMPDYVVLISTLGGIEIFPGRILRYAIGHRRRK